MISKNNFQAAFFICYRLAPGTVKFNLFSLVDEKRRRAADLSFATHRAIKSLSHQK